MVTGIETYRSILRTQFYLEKNPEGYAVSTREENDMFF